MKRRIVSSAFAGLLAAAVAAPSSSRAEEYIIVNGLPCGAFCRAWMGIKLPREAADAEKPPAPIAAAKTSKQSTAEAPATAHVRSRRTAAAREDAQARRRIAEDRAAEKASRKTKTEAAEIAAVQPAPRPPVRPETRPEAAKSPVPTPEASAPAQPSSPSPDAVAEPAKANPDQAAQADPAPGAIAETKPTEPVAPPTPEPTVIASPASPEAAVKPETADRSPAAAPAPQSSAVAEAKPSEPVASPTPEPSARGEEQRAANDPVASGPDASKLPQTDAKPDKASEPPPTAPLQVARLNEPAQTKASRVLIVLAKPEVKGVADLHDKSILVAVVDAIPEAELKASFAAAGAGGTMFRQGDIGDVEQIVNGDVVAAVVAVFPPDIAATFHEIPGYQVLRVDLARPPDSPAASAPASPSH